MQTWLRLWVLVCVAFSAGALRAQTEKNIGTVEVEGSRAISINVSGPGELGALANQAFNVHGAYRRVAGKAMFNIAFAEAGPGRVQVEVTKNGTSILSQTASGASSRQALLRAADLAVRATSGLPGFFASRLAFVSEKSGKSEIYVSDLFLGEARQLTRDQAFALTPRWSPDGTKLLYTSFYKSGFPDIFVLDLASMQRSTFASFKGTNSGARYSPDGSRVAMILSGEGNPELYVSNAQGRQVTRRTRTKDAVEASPCFSPDSSRIVYVSDSAGRAQLYVMPAGGGTPQRVSTGYSYSAEPDWSRGNPNLIAFTAGIGRGYQIGVYDFKGQRTGIVSNAPLDAVEPAWLADGRHLIYTARAANSRTLWILDTIEKTAKRLSSAPAEKASVYGP